MPRREIIQDRYLHKAYLDPRTPGAFSGLTTFARARKLKDLKQVEASLSKLSSFSRFRPPRTTYPRRHVVVKEKNEAVQIDLMDMTSLRRKNRNYGYILIGICVFTKYAAVVPTRTKSAKDMVPALRALFKKFKGKIQAITSDFGLEFYSKQAKELYKREGIKHYSTYSNLKAQTIERLIRTVKSKLWRWFHQNKTEYWLDVIEKLIANYNFTRHSSHGYIPALIRKKDHDQILSNLYSKFAQQKPKKPKYTDGSLVRLSDKKIVFRKKYMSHFSAEIFKVKCTWTLWPVISYKLEDLQGTELNGSYVEAEIVPAAEEQDGA